MERYDYLEAMKNDIREYLEDNYTAEELAEALEDVAEFETALYDDLWIVDSVTGNVVLETGTSHAVLLKGEQIPEETFEVGDRIKVFVQEVNKESRGPLVTLSRVHQNFVKRLFELEVPEIQDGSVIIKNVCREAGSRTKIAVFSKDENVDPIGACIGPKGTRVGVIVESLGGEKIDIVVYDEDPKKFIAAALAPANVLEVEIDEEKENSCHVTVPDTQLSLAIGNKGQNARLAARLTGWKIDIKPESGFYIPQNS